MENIFEFIFSFAVHVSIHTNFYHGIAQDFQE